MHNIIKSRLYSSVNIQKASILSVDSGVAIQCFIMALLYVYVKLILNYGNRARFGNQYT